MLISKLLRRFSHMAPEAEDSDRPGWRTTVVTMFMHV